MFSIPNIDLMLNARPNIVHGIKKYETVGANQKFKVPEGVYLLWVTLIAGGGSNTTTGIAAFFGNLLTTTGGTAAGVGGSPNGYNANIGPTGGGSPFGSGGSISAGKGFGGGGSIAGGGGWYVDEPVTVKGRQEILITVPAGVGGGGTAETNGTQGLCIVKW